MFEQSDSKIDGYFFRRIVRLNVSWFLCQHRKSGFIIKPTERPYKFFFKLLWGRD